MSTTENPFAFPSGSVDIDEYEKSAFKNGITLRDYFAAKAMQGLITHWSWLTADKKDLTFTAYGYADAMLKARKKQ